MTDIALCDFEPRLDTFREEVLAGLRSEAKTLPCKYFYDDVRLAAFRPYL